MIDFRFIWRINDRYDLHRTRYRSASSSAEDSRQFPQAEQILCERYGDLFNRRAQNFRLQKRNPAVVLGHKHEGIVLDIPNGFGIGGERNFYFSHMLNCVYDCRYCFLQGMYQSAHYIIFVNFEDFEEALVASARADPVRQSHYFSGYDCDSLAFDHVTEFVDYFRPVFERLDNAWLELCTKSVQIRSLEQRTPTERVIVAFSLSPADVVDAFEHKTPTLERRIAAMARLAELGWKLGIRFDPLIYHDAYQRSYSTLFEHVFSRISVRQVHSVTLGVLRFPKEMFNRIVHLYPDERLFAGPLETGSAHVSYRHDLQREMHDFCRHALLRLIPEEMLFSCSSF